MSHADDLFKLLEDEDPNINITTSKLNSTIAEVISEITESRTYGIALNPTVPSIPEDDDGCLVHFTKEGETLPTISVILYNGVPKIIGLAKGQYTLTASFGPFITPGGITVEDHAIIDIGTNIP